MNDVVIKIDNLGKMYQIGETLRHDTFRDLATDLFNRHVLRKDMPKDQKTQTIWALKNVSFEVKRGEVVGIIGRNGAGKSTLLKILSRITEPTEGRAEIRGRVGSLLEVGTGFHPELTGRENIYLNGAILGMSKNEIHKRFDEIVSFAEIEKFLDTPVKRYSSGMYVRLAFAVAAHLEPEIMIVDEVLAVGDAAFQKRCLGKMGEVAKLGRTILFVSHNMAAVSSLCTSGIVLTNGAVVFHKDEAKKAVDFYNRTVVGNIVNLDLEKRKERTGSGRMIITNITYHDKNNVRIPALACGQHVKIRIYYKVFEKINNISVALGFNTWTGENKIILWSELVGKYYSVEKNTGYFECEVERFPLSPGIYLINVFSRAGEEIIDWVREASIVDVMEGDFYGTGKMIDGSFQSVMTPQKWI